MIRSSLTIHQLSQQLQDLARSNLASRMELIRFPGIFIYYTQGPKTSSFYRGVVDEVSGPNMTPVFGLGRMKPVLIPRRLFFFLGGGPWRHSSRRT